MIQSEGWDTVLIKRIRNSLAAKVFLLLTVILLVISLGICLVITYFMPEIYENELSEVLEDGTEELIKELESYETAEKAGRILKYFEDTYKAETALLDQEKDMVYPFEGQVELNSVIVAEKQSATAFETDATLKQHLDLSAMKSYDIQIGKETYTLFVMGNMQPVSQAAEVLRRIVPWVAAGAFFLSFLAAGLCARYIAGPVRKLSRISRQMAELDFHENCQVGSRKDELGLLGADLNTLSGSLSETLKNLEQANEELKSDMEKKEEEERNRIAFFSAVSHELKTPITILKGHLGGMLDKVGAYSNRDYYLERSRQVAGDMEDMVQELLTIFRMESQGKEVIREKTDLAEQMRMQLGEMAELMEQKEQHLCVNMPDHCYGQVQSKAMMHVFRNLLSNAVRYTPGGEYIRVFMENREDGIFCSVENTGVTLPGEGIPRLFDAFYRVESSRNRGSGGSGLGLYIVKTVLKEHKASYGAENTADGVCFWFLL